MTRASSALRIGILSTAKIAADFVRGVSASAKVVVAAVASREESRAKRFAREHGIGAVFDSYEALLADPGLDAIYNPLPNSLHAPWSVKALESGKHVLCEKPLAMSCEEARRMFEAARRAGLQLVEAYPYRAQPLTQKLQQLLASGAIGRIESVHASFGFSMPSASNIRLNAAMGGGALLDAGCYPISLIRMIGGECPVRVHANARYASSGVDKTVAATFEFDNGLLAQMSCSFGTAVHRQALIAGSAGVIETNYWNNPPPDRPAAMRLRRGTSWGAAHEYESVEAPAMNGFLAEAESFCDLVQNGSTHWTGATETESIDIARMIDATKCSMQSRHAETVRP